jgi:hypothetical protein
MVVEENNLVTYLLMFTIIQTENNHTLMNHEAKLPHVNKINYFIENLHVTLFSAYQA